MKKCLICTSSQIKKTYQAGPDYPLELCQNCGFYYDSNAPDEPESVYEKNYYVNPDIKGGYFNYFEEAHVNRLTFKYRLKKLQKIYPGTKSRTNFSSSFRFNCSGNLLDLSKNT